MKYLNIAMCGLMILFAIVQYNDPDAIFWVTVYVVPAVCAGLAAFHLQIPRNRALQGLFGVCLAAAIAGSVFYWPHTPGFWRIEVWWNTETAREGMGMMIATLAIGIAIATVATDTARRRRRRHGADSELKT
jgi:hypothetical protein